MRTTSCVHEHTNVFGLFKIESHGYRNLLNTTLQPRRKSKPILSFRAEYLQSVVSIRIRLNFVEVLPQSYLLRKDALLAALVHKQQRLIAFLAVLMKHVKINLRCCALSVRGSQRSVISVCAFSNARGPLTR